MPSMDLVLLAVFAHRRLLTSELASAIWLVHRQAFSKCCREVLRCLGYGATGSTSLLWLVRLASFLLFWCESTSLKDTSLLFVDLFFFHLAVWYDVCYQILAQKVVIWCQIVRDSILPNLQREDVTLGCDVQEPLVVIFESQIHGLNEIRLIDVFFILWEQLLVHISHQLLQKWFFNLNC